MQLRNSPSRYGVVSIVLHWGVALAVFGLFGLGLWMVGLDYYSAWYRTAPHWHKGLGVLLFAVLLARLAWRLGGTPPEPVEGSSVATRRLAALAHGGLYLLLLAVPLSGYLISTANGRPVEVFGWFSVPAVLSGLPDQADLAGLAHRYLAWGLVLLAGLHAAAALKHHVIDRDPTLVRMLGRSSRNPQKG